MKQPKKRASKINAGRHLEWADNFSGFRTPITEARIDRWIDQFENSDIDLAARILDIVEFIGHEYTAKSFRQILGGLHKWDIDPDKRTGKWRFVSFSGPGKSGDSMVHQFRIANGMGHSAYNKLFIYRSDLIREKLSSDDTVVFIDDFTGTGDQACEAWEDQLRKLLPLNPTVYLVLVVACDVAMERINSETDMVVVPHLTLKKEDNIFQNKHFSRIERAQLLKYCTQADKKIPKGYGECGLVLVFNEKCPNNSIPILHKSNSKWIGLFA